MWAIKLCVVVLLAHIQAGRVLPPAVLTSAGNQPSRLALQGPKRRRRHHGVAALSEEVEDAKLGVVLLLHIQAGRVLPPAVVSGAGDQPPRLALQGPEQRRRHHGVAALG